MRDLRLSLRNTALLLRRSRSFGLFIAVGVAFAVLCGGLVSQAARAAEHQVRESSIMRTVEVSSFGVSKPIPLTRDRMEEIARLPGVVSIQPWIQSGCLVTESDIEVPGALWATPRMSAGQPPLIAATRVQPLPMAANEVILPAHVQNKDLRALLGKDVTVEYTRRLTTNSGEAAFMRLHVIGLYDETIGGRDGPAAVYLSLDTALTMAAAREGVTPDAFGRNVGYPKVIAEVARASDVGPTQQRLTEMGYNASSIQSQLKSLPPAMELVSILGQLMAVALIVICLGAGLSIGAGLVRARIREIGLLKALGFSNARVAKLFALELGFFGLGSAVTGVIIGVAAFLIAQQVLRGQTLFDVQMADTIVFPSPLHIALLMVAPAGAMLIGGILPMRTAATLAPDLALRDPS